MQEPHYASASVRNSEPIWGVLRDELADRNKLLEIGSGTGYHAVRFASELPHIEWQTSDLEENHANIEQAIASSGARNVLRPLALDVRSATLPNHAYDAAYSCNTAHIMSFAAVQKMFALVGHALADGGLFCLYGPMKRNGQFNTTSNAEFDAALRGRDSHMGIRDLEDCDRFATDTGMLRLRVYAMPTNNLLVVWQKQQGADLNDNP